MGLIREVDIDPDDLVAMVKAWRAVRDLAALTASADCFRSSELGRVWYGDLAEKEAIDRLNERQLVLMTVLRSVAAKLGKSWSGDASMGWVPVGGFLKEWMEVEDSEVQLVYEAQRRDEALN